MILYVGINLALVAVFSLLGLLLSVTERRAIAVPFRHQLFLSRALLCGTLVATIGAMWFVRQADLRWSLGIASFEDANVPGGGTFEPFAELSVPNLHFPEAVRLPTLMTLLMALLLAVALLETLRTIRQYRELAAVLRRSIILRRHRRAVIVVSDRVGVPFSLRTLRSRWVVLPSHLLGNRKDLRFAVAHELQHHRQGDTSWAWISRALSIVFWPNPVVHLWRRWDYDVQELACDKALLDRPGFEVEEYAGCLLSVAERALTERQAFEFAPSMASPRGDARTAVTHLQKRIEMLFASSPRRLSRPLVAAASAAAICCAVCISALAAGLTSAPREPVVEVAAPDAAEPALFSAAIGRGAVSVESICEEFEEACREGPATLESNDPTVSSNDPPASADDPRRSGESLANQSLATECDCAELSLDPSVSCAH